MRYRIKYYLIALGLVSILGSCNSVKKFNSQIEKPKSPIELKADIDYVHKKLQKLHPNLYWYISKKDLDYKFDSLKSTITAPMTSNELYYKLSPVVASVRQGHMRLSPVTKRATKREKKEINKKGPFPLSQFNYEVIDNKLYITKNLSKDSTIRVGSEVVSVNGVKPQDIFKKFDKTFASDGFNTTLTHRYYSWQFPNFFYVYTNQHDSVSVQLRIKDSLTAVTLVHDEKLKSEDSKIDSPTKSIKIDKKTGKLRAKAEGKKQRLQGYNPQTKEYSKNLSFIGPENSIALLKINDFARGNYRKYFQYVFNKIDSIKPKALIIDLRDNPGGRIREISHLYAYLTDTNFIFIDKMEVTSRTNFVLGSISNTTPILIKALTYTIGLPLLVVRMAKVHKKDGKYFYTISESKVKKANSKAYKGKLYVLINGGSFSASSIISSNLKGSKRAVFVGEETGGAYNGCVAGSIPLYTLPNTKLRLRLGLAVIKPHYKSEIDGRGIFPDVTITPTADDLLNKNDPEVNWVIEDVKKSGN